MKIKINKKIAILGLLVLIIVVFSAFVLSLNFGIETGEANNTYFQKYNQDGQLIVYFFWDRSCPVCENQKPFLEEIEKNYENDIEIKSFEIRTSENIRFFQEIGEAYGMNPRGVPTTFIGDRYWVGFAGYLAEEMENEIQRCIEIVC